MSDGDVTLEQMVDSLRRTPDVLADVMPKLAAAVKRHLRAANAAGVTPEGVPYQRTQEGLIPLRGGQKAITVTFDSTTLIARVRGVEALHSLGEARGQIARRMLPENEAPPELLAELERIIERELTELLG